MVFSVRLWRQRERQLEGHVQAWVMLRSVDVVGTGDFGVIACCRTGMLHVLKFVCCRKWNRFRKLSFWNAKQAPDLDNHRNRFKGPDSANFVVFEIWPFWCCDWRNQQEFRFTYYFRSCGCIFVVLNLDGPKRWTMDASFEAKRS